MRRSLVEDKFGEEARSSGTVKAVIKTLDLIYYMFCKYFEPQCKELVV